MIPTTRTLRRPSTCRGRHWQECKLTFFFLFLKRSAHNKARRVNRRRQLRDSQASEPPAGVDSSHTGRGYRRRETPRASANATQRNAEKAVRRGQAREDADFFVSSSWRLLVACNATSSRRTTTRTMACCNNAENTASRTQESAACHEFRSGRVERVASETETPLGLA